MSQATSLLDEIVTHTLAEFVTHPGDMVFVTTEDITNRVSSIWAKRGYREIEINNRKVGMSMSRLGFRPHRPDGSVGRGWLIE